MAGTKISVEGVLADVQTLILTNIGREQTREALIGLHPMVSGKAVSVASNLGGGWHGHLTRTMIVYYYMAHMGYAFVPLHNSGNYPPTMVTYQDQALGTERLQQN